MALPGLVSIPDPFTVARQVARQVLARPGSGAHRLAYRFESGPVGGAPRKSRRDSRQTEAAGSLQPQGLCVIYAGLRNVGVMVMRSLESGQRSLCFILWSRWSPWGVMGHSYARPGAGAGATGVDTLVRSRSDCTSCDGRSNPQCDSRTPAGLG